GRRPPPGIAIPLTSRIDAPRLRPSPFPLPKQGGRMAMVQVIDWQSRERFSDVVEQMHRLRKEVFIDFYKWGLSHRDGLEIDQFDTPEALYLLDCDPKTGTLASSLRLLPTTGLHMMESLFPHLCANGYPRGDQVFEISRL